MTYKLLRHKDFTAEWEKLPSTIRDQFKKKLAKVIEQPHIPKNILRGDLEPYRVCRRPLFLRECPDEKSKIHP